MTSRAMIGAIVSVLAGLVVFFTGMALSFGLALLVLTAVPFFVLAALLLTRLET